MAEGEVRPRIRLLMNTRQVVVCIALHIFTALSVLAILEDEEASRVRQISLK